MNINFPIDWRSWIPKRKKYALRVRFRGTNHKLLGEVIIPLDKNGDQISTTEECDIQENGEISHLELFLYDYDENAFTKINPHNVECLEEMINEEGIDRTVSTNVTLKLRDVHVNPY